MLHDKKARLLYERFKKRLRERRVSKASSCNAEEAIAKEKRRRRRKEEKNSE